jgi:hypothetical protein
MGDGTNVLVFSLHGMRPNTDRTYLLPRILNSILDARLKHAQQSYGGYSSLQRIRDGGATWLPLAFPPSSLTWKLARAFYHVQDFRRKLPKVDASAFSLVSCLNGYIRINLRGREKNGMVEPGEAYDQLCSAIIEDFKTFVDADTGEPIIEQIMRSDELFETGPRLGFLPDLVVRWASIPAIYNRKVVSNRYPRLSISMPLRNLNGRSGNHSSEGFMLAVGGGILPYSLVEKGDILDLAPTIFALLGVDKPIQMRGNSLLAKVKDDATFSG